MKTSILISLVLAASLMASCDSSSPDIDQMEDSGPKEIAITIDDVPLADWPNDFALMDRVSTRMIEEINTRGIPVVGFVNESLLYVTGGVDERIATLRQWSNATELGNHTFSHMGFTSDTSLEIYQEDITRGATVTSMLLAEQNAEARYFRHPYLRMGETRELEMQLEQFLEDHGYQVAPVSIDIDDWMFGPAYLEALDQGDEALARRVADEFLRHAEAMLLYCERMSMELLGYQMRHILLIHAHQLTADTLGDLMAMFERHGYRTISLERALEDPAYRYPESSYIPDSYWLAQIARSQNLKLRYPREADFVRELYQMRVERIAAAKAAD